MVVAGHSGSPVRIKYHRSDLFEFLIRNMLEYDPRPPINSRSELNTNQTINRIKTQRPHTLRIELGQSPIVNTSRQFKLAASAFSNTATTTPNNQVGIPA